MIEAGSKLGLEMEMVVVHKKTVESHPVQEYFSHLAKIKKARGVEIYPKDRHGEDFELITPLGKSGIDNGFNLLETSFSPVQEGRHSLSSLAKLIDQELGDVITALDLECATLLNASNHPYCRIDLEWYSKVCAPRNIYKELVSHRKWHHWVGIDSKAQNSPCTSIDIKQAVRALNVILGLSSAFIALYANSPIEGGSITGLKETRMTMWNRMFKNARFLGDFFLHCLPKRPFNDLGDYFRWMFGSGTVTRALSMNSLHDYKNGQSIFLYGNPSLIAFLYSSKWIGYCNRTNSNITLVPNVRHFVYSQFAHFLDARWRYSLHSFPPMHLFLKGWERPNGIEELFQDYGVDGYIEGRAPGAVFSDSELIDEQGKGIASKVVISPSALQLGLLRNIEASEKLVYKWGWLRLKSMRVQAVKHALDDKLICKLVKEVLYIARQGLEKEDQHWLDYPRAVFESRRTGADRLLRIWNSSHGKASERLVELSEIKTIKLPNS